MPKRKPKVDWRCTKDHAGAESCLGFRNGKRTLVTMQTDGVVTIMGKKLKCDKARILSSEVLICGSEVAPK